MVLHGKVVIVTGASDGIGQAIAQRLADEGPTLALLGRDGGRLKSVVTAITAAGGQAQAFECDMKDRSHIKKTVQDIADTFGGIDVLINNAGIWQKVMPLEEIDDDVIDDVLTTNLRGTIFITKDVLPHLQTRKTETAIINIVSKSGQVAQAGQAIYTASKFGLRGLTDVLRVDLKDSSVRIGAVYQAGINTQMFAKTGESVPLEKFTQPADLADAVTYMLTRPPKIWLPEIHVTY